MIVECNNCDTRFQLDDSRVPLRGIRVRCSRCKEAFFLEHPDASRADAIDDVASEAAHGAPPDSTQDLPPTAATGAGEARGEADEEDWEFNEDLPAGDAGDDMMEPPDEPDTAATDPPGIALDDDPGPDLSEADDGAIPGLGVDDMSVDDEDDLVSGLDLAGDGDTDLAGDAGEEEESAFGEVSDFGALSAPPDPSAEPIPATSAAPAPAPPTAAAVAPQDIGEPEDWDFFSDDSGEESALESMDNAMGRVMEAVEDPSRLERPSRGPDLGTVRSAKGPHRGLRSIGRGLGWAVTCSLLAIGVARGVFDVSTAGARPASSVDLGILHAQQVSGSWLETARATRVYAVGGQLLNPSDVARLPGQGLRVVLLSPTGQRLEFPAAPFGVPIRESQLRELTPEELAAAQRDAVARLSGTRLEPGQGVAFQAFFDGIPDAATGFVIEQESNARIASGPAHAAVQAPLDTLAPVEPGLGGQESPLDDPEATADAEALEPLLRTPTSAAPESAP